MMVLGGLAETSHAGLFGTDETPGERFRKAIAREAEYCATHKIKPTNRRCDITTLQPADPLATEEGRFAHSIRIPNPVPADSGYKPGMTSQEYFEHLCKTEAGEFIYKTVENVEGLYMMRPRNEATDNELEHLHALEDPYGHVTGTTTEQAFALVRPDAYQFIEEPLSTFHAPSWKKPYRDSSLFTIPNEAMKYVRYFGFDAHDMKSMRMEYDRSLRSRYGFTWRGISRPNDREMGIVGGELIILEIASNDVVAVRRGFIKSGNVKNLTGIWWLSGQVCPVGSGPAEHGGETFILKAVNPLHIKGMHHDSR
ncbi:MAG: hypothetical protein LKG23_07080 [Nitrospira sp.]|nr:hypothetical protein [Nitrospira sp.]